MSRPEHEHSFLIKTIRHAAEEKLRRQVGQLIEKELEEIVDELTTQFMEEFKAEVDVFLSEDVRSMGASLTVDIRRR